jgi:hypothetical protein
MLFYPNVRWLFSPAKSTVDPGFNTANDTVSAWQGTGGC